MLPAPRQFIERGIRHSSLNSWPKQLNQDRASLKEFSADLVALSIDMLTWCYETIVECQLDVISIRLNSPTLVLLYVLAPH
jgi:hypothetical protein